MGGGLWEIGRDVQIMHLTGLLLYYIYIYIICTRIVGFGGESVV